LSSGVAFYSQNVSLRRKLIRAFAMLENKAAKLPKKKHGNLPL
jgi:acetyl-CoA carboxylase carboxyltransferase component